MEVESMDTNITIALSALKENLQKLQTLDEEAQKRMREKYAEISKKAGAAIVQLGKFTIPPEHTIDDALKNNLYQKINALNEPVNSMLELDDTSTQDIRAIIREFNHGFDNFMPTFLSFRIKTAIDNCVRDGIETLIESPEWGPINFKSSRRDFERLFSTLHVLKDIQLDCLSIKNLTSLASYIKAIEDALESIRGFDIGAGSGLDVRDDLALSLKNCIDAFYDSISAYMVFPVFGQHWHDEHLSNLHHREARLSELTNKAEDIITTAQRVSGRTGVMGYTGDFGKTASDHKKWARCWLAATTLLGAGALFVAGGSFFNSDVETLDSIAGVIRNAISKFIFLGFLVSATLWCGKQYRAQKHQEAINRHRANSLGTFEAFANAAKTDDSRDAVLVETTRSIFAHRPTGYIGAGESSSDHGTKITEVVKNVGKSVTHHD